jgi:hypothetical protein
MNVLGFEIPQMRMLNDAPPLDPRADHRYATREFGALLDRRPPTGTFCPACSCGRWENRGRSWVCASCGRPPMSPDAWRAEVAANLQRQANDPPLGPRDALFPKAARAELADRMAALADARSNLASLEKAVTPARTAIAEAEEAHELSRNTLEVARLDNSTTMAVSLMSGNPPSAATIRAARNAVEGAEDVLATRPSRAREDLRRGGAGSGRNQPSRVDRAGCGAGGDRFGDGRPSGPASHRPCPLSLLRADPDGRTREDHLLLQNRCELLETFGTTPRTGTAGP